MTHKKFKMSVICIGLSLMMTTGVWASALDTADAQETPAEDTAVLAGDTQIEDVDLVSPEEEDIDEETQAESELQDEGMDEEDAELEEKSSEADADASDDAEDEMMEDETEDDETELLNAKNPGWYTSSKGNVYYYDFESVAVKGWQIIDENIYYFSEKGIMKTGWRKIGDETFYFNPSGDVGKDGGLGSLQTGWVRVGSKIFYFKENGALGTIGKRTTGWKKINGNIFYFATSGKAGVKGGMQTGWMTKDGYRYFFQKTGTRGNKGKLLTGYQKIGKYAYYFKTKGALGVKGRMYKNGLKTLAGNQYYFKADGKIAYGWKRIGNYWYYFDKSNKGRAVTGWKYIKNTTSKKSQYESLRYYFNPKKNSSGPKGALIQDVSSIIGKQSSYQAVVDRTTCVVTMYAKDTSGKWRIPVKAFTCSVGLPATPTPKSGWNKPFKTLNKYRWATLMGPSYGQYATRIVSGILFHSVAGSNTTSYNLAAGNYNMLGSPASHGCVRLCVRDAKWIYDNCPLGMRVVINDNLFNPFDKPATIKIPAGQTYDPTDPAV